MASVTASLAPVTPIRNALGGDYLFSAMRISPARAVAELLRVCFPDARTALDLTYGHGRFWDGTAHVAVTGLDRDPGRAPHVVADFRALPFADDAFDVAVFDPPFLSDGGAGSVMAARYTAYRSEAEARASIALGCAEAWRVGRLGALVKVQDSHHGGRFVELTRWVADAIPVPLYDRVEVPNERRKIIDPKWRQPQLSTYRRHSTYLLFRKDGPMHRRRPASIGGRCAICGAMILDRRRDAATCSDRCRQKAYRRRLKAAVQAPSGPTASSR